MDTFATDGWSNDSTCLLDREPAVGRRELCRDVEMAWRRLQEAEVRLASTISAWERGNGWVGDGALSASGWLRHRLGIGHGHAIGILKFSRGLRDHVDVADAVTDAVLSTDKAYQLLAKFTEARAFYAERDVHVLIDQASRLTVQQCKTLMAVWAARVDAEIESTNPGEPKASENSATKSELFVSEIGDGQVIINGSLDIELGETVRTALDLARKILLGENPDETAIDSETVEETQSNGKSSDQSTEAPGDPTLADDRSPAEQRADALGLLARFFLDHNTDIGMNAGTRPHVQVEIDLEVLEQRHGGLALLQHGKHGFDIEQTLRLCCDSDISRVIMQGPSEIIDIGRKTRVVPVATAKAVRRRDRHCRFPGCDMSYRYTEIHHFIHWINGGPTDLANLFLLCWRHHRLAHRKGHDAWTITGQPNGTLTFTSPHGDTHTTGPPGKLT